MGLMWKVEEGRWWETERQGLVQLHGVLTRAVLVKVVGCGAHTGEGSSGL